MAVSLLNLAGVLSSLGKFADAQRLYRQALGVYKHILPPEHPAVARAMESLAAVVRAQGKVRSMQHAARNMQPPTCTP